MCPFSTPCAKIVRGPQWLAISLGVGFQILSAAQALEASREGGVPEELASNFCRVAKVLTHRKATIHEQSWLSTDPAYFPAWPPCATLFCLRAWGGPRPADQVPLRGQLTLSVACLNSAHAVSRTEGAKFLKAKLKEYTSSGQKFKLPESLLHALLLAIRGPELEETMEEKDRDTLFKQLVELHPDVDTSKSPIAGLAHIGRTRRQEKPTTVANLSLLSSGDGSLEGVRACDILEEVGRGTTSGQAVRDVLSLFPNIGASGLAEIVCMAVRTCGTSVDPNSNLAAGVLTAAVRDTWNDSSASSFNQIESANSKGSDGAQDVVAIVEAVKECVKGAPWTEVFEVCFDLPDLVVPDKRAFRALIAAHRCACGEEPFPVSVVLRLRRNTAAQLQFLKHAAEAEPAVLTFTEASSKMLKPVAGLPGAEDEQKIGGPNHCWASTSFVSVLFELAEVEDYGLVKSLFDVPLRSAPEALLICACLADDKSRGALRAEIFSKLAPPLLSDDSPHSTVVQTTLAQRAPDKLKKLLKSMQEKDPDKALPKIMEILQKDKLVSFYAQLLHGPPTELSFQLALLGDSRGALALQTWLKDNLAEHKDAAASGVCRFLKTRLQAVPGKDKGNATPYLPPSVDEADLMRRCLDELERAIPTLSSEPGRQVQELANLAHQKYPTMAPSGPPPEAPPSANPPPPSAPPPGPPPAPASGAPQQPLSPEELEESSNGYFSKIYTGEITVPQLIEIMKDFAVQQKGSWKHEVYGRMIQNLFDECRFFPKYPPQDRYSEQ